MGRFAQTIDSLPDRQWPPSTVVTGVTGGYDVNVRQMAADGIRVLGRVLDASDGALAIARNANEVLEEVDKAFAGFLVAAREFAETNPDLELTEDDPTGSPVPPVPVAEVESLNLQRENVATIVWATGYDYDWLQVPVLDLQGRPIQHRGIGPLLPGAALDAHIQIRPIRGRRERRRIPRRAPRPHITGED